MTDEPEDNIPPEGLVSVEPTPLVPANITPTPMGVMRFSPEVEKIFYEEPGPTEIHIRDTGEVYIPQQIYRDRLFKAFGPGGWGLREIGVIKDNNVAYFEGVLVCANQIVAKAVGECEYYPNNPQAKWTHAIDAAKSECLKKCCKDLIPGFHKLWDRAWTDAWRDQYGYEHWRKQKPGSRDSKPKWRRKDMAPHYAETGPTPGQKDRDRGIKGPAVDAPSGSRGSAALREAEGLPPQEESPAAYESRREEFEDLLGPDMPLELGCSDLRHIIDLADTVKQLNHESLLGQIGRLKEEDKAELRAAWGRRKHEIDPEAP